MLQANDLYLRGHELQLVVVPPVEGKAVANYSNVGTGISITTRVSFSCEKTSLPNVNKSRIQIYNINSDTGKFIDNNNLVVLLKAGYGGSDNLKNVFVGDVLRRERSKQGADIITTLEVGDSERAFNRNAVEMSFKGKTSTKQILDRAIAAMGVGENIIQGFTDKTIENGFSYSGTASELIKKLVGTQRLDFFVDSGVLTIKPFSEASIKNSILINEKTGLIGVPTKSQIGVTFQTLLNGSLVPGQLVKLESRMFSGQVGIAANLTASAANIESGDFVTVVTANHDGDSRGSNWVTSVDAIKVGVKKSKKEGEIHVEK